MSNTSKQKRFRWLFALAVCTASSSGCGSWSHHVGKHSMLAYFHKKHHSPYTQCEDCGQIILNDRYHQCNQCTPQPAFYGYKSTCWNAWPMGWSPCPAPATNSCLVDGESVVLQESVSVPVSTPNETASVKPVEPSEKNEHPAKVTVPLPEDEPTTVNVDESPEGVDRTSGKGGEVLDDSASLAPPAFDDDDTVNVSRSSPSWAEQEAEEKVSEPEIDSNLETRVDGTDDDLTVQKAESTESEESSGEEENVVSIDEEVFVHVERTTPAINTSFEVPSVPKTQAPIPVAPASAVVATLPPTEIVTNEVKSEPIVSESKSKFTELKRLLKEARSTALHVSQAKQPVCQESETLTESNGLQRDRNDFTEDRMSLEEATEKSPDAQPAMLAMPVVKKVSLLDRLCPKSTN